MILVAKRLDFISYQDIETRSELMHKIPDAYCDLNKYDDPDITGVLLDTRQFDVTKYPNLKVISRVGVGLDNIDLEECKKRNIKVYTTKCDELYTSVAEFTIKQIFNLLAVKEMRPMLEDKLAAVIGHGYIGSMVAVYLNRLGCHVTSFDKAIYMNTYHIYELKKKIHQYDIVTVHISGTDCVIGQEEIALMKDGSYLLNMARAGCVDKDAAVKAVLSDKLAGYASDVDYDCVKSTGRILFTQHIASRTIEARKKMEQLALENLVKGLSE